MGSQISINKLYFFLQSFHMMAHSTASIVLVAALLINTLSYCSAENVCCVTPTATSCSSCPHNSIHCATLSEYAQEAELHFTSNTTMVFSPGDHVLDRNITIVNVASLTMRGQSSSGKIATVVRNGSVGFSFTNMVDFNIYSLAFTSYNRPWGYDGHPASNSALLLQSTQNAKLVNCSFHDNLGTALTVNSTNITLEENIKFIHNQCACKSFSEMCKLGCGITALNSNLTFTGNTTFHENNASFRYCAGAIWASASLLHFHGVNNFIGNSARYGGAIHALANTSISFSGTNNFTHNSAYSGGALYTSAHVVLIFKGINNFFNNLADSEGGAIHATSNTLSKFIGTSFFGHNSAGYDGGTIYTESNVVLTFNGTTKFTGNSAINGQGGAILTRYNVAVTFTGTNNFFNNSAGYSYSSGGAIYAANNVEFTFTGTNNFSGNLVHRTGGAIYTFGTFGNVVLIFNGTNTFFNNSAGYFGHGGALVAQHNVLLSFIGTSNFVHNTAYSGGVFFTFDNIVLTFNGSNNFINNSINKVGGLSGANGGAFHVFDNVVLTFNGTNNFINNLANNGSGGAINAQTNTWLMFIGTSHFSHNSAVPNFGGAIYMKHNVVLTFNGTTNLFNNSAGGGGVIYAAYDMSMSFTGTSNFSRNSAMYGGAIFATDNSTLTFDGSVSFTNNGFHIHGNSQGGAMYLAIHSTFSILPNTTVYWENNHASLGGAIYASNYNPLIYCTQIAPYIQQERCFFQISSLSGIQLVFKNNSADITGSVLYGGAIDKCTLDWKYYKSGKVFDMLVQYEADNTTSSISSDPFRVCRCENNHPECSKRKKPLSVYPGETFQVSAITVGQRDGIVPAQVISHINRGNGRLQSSQYVQQTTKMCTTLNYTVFSQYSMSQLELYADGSCSTFGDELVFLLNINQTCPPGFGINREEHSCVCDQALQKYTNHCNITNGLGQITRESDDTFWVGYNEFNELILHPHCPFDYCVNDAVVFPLNDTDIQCAYNRSGLLCGACNRAGYSLVLGTSHCKQCTNIHLLLLIPFTLMGVALVFLLLVCKLTVATGTLSGLVFYANIVGANYNIFLPVRNTDALSVFIAWLNLDFGIETCFYDGMDAYTKTWLQFVFPVYIWVLVVLMILVSHYSERFANMLGSNPVSVLATLILLSYAKILRTFITAVYVTYLKYPANYSRMYMVWLHDANIDYLSGKHVPLFLVAMLVFLFLFLPYTLLLLFCQCLQAISHLRLFSWVNSAKLKPFIDSYHAPYKAKHRYWPGLLLLLRFALLLVFAINPQQDPSINLLAILVGTGILHLWAWVSGGVYKNWCLDALEGSFALNLIVLAAATYHVQLSGGNQLAVGYTSVFIVLATFIGILAYHIFQRLRHTKLWKKASKLNFEFKKLITKQAVNNLNNPFNDSTESANLNQLREPWLEDLLQPTHSSL